MFFFFALLATLPLALFVMDPNVWSFLPWLSFALFIFGSWILIPRRRLVFTIPLLGAIGSLGALLILVEYTWLASIIVAGIGGGAWMWWRATAVHRDHARLHEGMLHIMALLFVYGMTHGVQAWSIYLNTSFFVGAGIVFVASLFFFCAYMLLTINTDVHPFSWLIPAAIMSVLYTESFVATHYLPIALSLKALALALMTTAALYCARHEREGTLTAFRARSAVISSLGLILILWWTASWI